MGLISKNKFKKRKHLIFVNKLKRLANIRHGKSIDIVKEIVRQSVPRK